MFGLATTRCGTHRSHADTEALASASGPRFNKMDAINWMSRNQFDETRPISLVAMARRYSALLYALRDDAEPRQLINTIVARQCQAATG